MLPFAKYSGAGNDFVLLEEGSAAGLDPGRLARRLCPRATGVGVDGMVLVAREGGARHRLRFFNPDGSEFSTCGNGSRCAARFVVDQGWVDGPEVELGTADGPVHARVEGRQVGLRYRIPVRLRRSVAVELDRETRSGTLVEIGTPHFVLSVPSLPSGDIEERCRAIRHHRAFGPEGTNVNLVELTDRRRGRIRTYERGVEGETLACGSGAMAAALALRAAGSVGAELALETRSGATLTVGLEGAAGSGRLAEEPEEPVTIRLTGPARFVFDGRFPAEDLAGPGSYGRSDPGRGPD